MNLMIDRFFQEDVKWAPHTSFVDLWGEYDTRNLMKQIVHLAPHALVFDITNVADYYHSTLENHPEDMGRAFPNVAPPAPVVWMEYRGKHGGLVGTTHGLLMVSKLTDDAQWEIDIFIIGAYPWEKEADICGPLAYLRASVNQDGILIGPLHMHVPHHAEVDPEDQASIDALADEREYMLPIVYPALFALSLLHCKNVVVQQENGLPKTRQARRQLERSGETPPTTFHTLQIEPMKQVLATEGGIAHNGLKKALHICRGHFAEYGDEYGKGKLFGKYEGRFWMPAHVRGSADSGVALKDYNVKAPRKDAA